MATAAMSTVPPPPGGQPQSAPPNGADASPAPAAPSPQLEQGSRLVIQTVQALRKLAQDFPAAAPDISKINDLMRSVQLKVMSGSKPTEPAAPPAPSA
jgi:hypothetical protein